MTGYALTIPQQCVPKGRPRFTKNGGVFTPKATQLFEGTVAHLAALEWGAASIEGPLEVEITCVMKRPQYLQTRQVSMGRLYHGKRPDIDNLAKAVLDGLGAYFDDGQVASLRVLKCYAQSGETAATHVRVTELQGLEVPAA